MQQTVGQALDEGKSEMHTLHGENRGLDSGGDTVGSH